MDGLFASFRESRFSQPEISARAPTSCPYCPGTVGCHWSKAATYPRYGLGSERIRVQRFRCRITGRTFSLLPDALLPYHHPTAATILGWLDNHFIHGHGTAATARTFLAASTTVRRVCSKFRDAVKILRLPGHQGALAPADFLRRLAGRGIVAVADLFATWKEFEPKHSLVGVHPR